MVAVLTSSIVKSGSLHCSVRCSKALRVLERNAWKHARSVLRGERGSNAPDLPGNNGWDLDLRTPQRSRPLFQSPHTTVRTDRVYGGSQNNLLCFRSFGFGRWAIFCFEEIFQKWNISPLAKAIFGNRCAHNWATGYCPPSHSGVGKSPCPTFFHPWLPERS